MPGQRASINLFCGSGGLLLGFSQEDSRTSRGTLPLSSSPVIAPSSESKQGAQMGARHELAACLYQIKQSLRLTIRC